MKFQANVTLVNEDAIDIDGKPYNVKKYNENRRNELLAQFKGLSSLPNCWVFWEDFGSDVVAVWGETFVSSKVLLNAGLMPADIFLYRFTIAYLGMIAMSHRRMWMKSLKHELLIAICGIAGGSMYFLTENMALRYSTASNVAILVGTTPLVTAILLACCYKEERMSRRQVVGSLIALLGMILVVLNGQLVLHLNPRGDVLALCASALWGVYSLILKVVSPRYDAVFITRKVFGYGLITILPWFALVEPLAVDSALLMQPVIWGNLLWLGLVASLGCYLAWNWVLPRVGVVRSTNILYTQSAFTMAIAAIVLGERITWMAVAGVLVLIAGMAFMRRPTARESR